MRCRQRLEEASARKTIHRKIRLVQSSRCALSIGRFIIIIGSLKCWCFLPSGVLD
jgi:hypothetical protein